MEFVRKCYEPSLLAWFIGFIGSYIIISFLSTVLETSSCVSFLNVVFGVKVSFIFRKDSLRDKHAFFVFYVKFAAEPCIIFLKFRLPPSKRIVIWLE